MTSARDDYPRLDNLAIGRGPAGDQARAALDEIDRHRITLAAVRHELVERVHGNGSATVALALLDLEPPDR